MRKIAFIITAFLLGIIADVSAQEVHASTAGTATVRQVNQQARIAHGVATGQLTRPERRALKAEQRHIQRVKRRAKADGVVTRGEKVHINRKQRRANRHIRRQKNDSQRRY
ncbi:MAG: hypothetical protein DHS20C17_12880 [Cyclobacteriaceae bacterium]|nr:MAG: hypothetical protein DHS20C17_12880 [Cyclobacteriaceae bacterium]